MIIKIIVLLKIRIIMIPKMIMKIILILKKKNDHENNNDTISFLLDPPRMIPTKVN